MAIVGYLVLFVGAIISLVGGIMILVAAFRAGIWWGLGSLCLSPVALIFVITHWADSKKGFLIYLAGAVVVIIGVALLAAGGGGLPTRTTY